MLRKKEEKKLEDYSKEDYKYLAEAVAGGDLFYLKKSIATLGDEDIYIDLIKLERKFIDALWKLPFEDVMDVALWYLDNLEENINYMNLENKEELIRDIQRIRETLKKRYGV